LRYHRSEFQSSNQQTINRSIRSPIKQKFNNLGDNKITSLGIGHIASVPWPQLKTLSISIICHKVDENKIGSKGGKLLSKS
jgi:hypothetical protein